MAPRNDPQLPRRQSGDQPSGLEPALPGNGPAFDPIWLMMRQRLEGWFRPIEPDADDYAVWMAAVAAMVIPVLRENRLGTRDEPIQITLFIGWDVSKSYSTPVHWYFDPWAEVAEQCIAVSADQRDAVGTQLGARLALSISNPDAEGRCRVRLFLRRFGAGPDNELCTEHVARRNPQGQWEIGPGKPSAIRLSDLPA